MKPILISVLMFVPFALGARWVFVCETLHWCARGSLAQAPAFAAPLTHPDGTTHEVAFAPYEAGVVEAPHGPASARALDSLVALMATAPDHVLHIEGPVRPGEPAPGLRVGARAYRDIGVARAAGLAAELQRRGANGDLLALDAYTTTGDAALVPRLSFRPYVPKAMSDGLPEGELLLDSMAFLGLRFAANSTALEPTPEFIDYATDLVEALNARPALRLSLIGHTDDQAEASHNDSLGFWRAQAVARYFTQLGLNSPVGVATRGEREPLGPNTTPEGRYLNRRVEARIR